MSTFVHVIDVGQGNMVLIQTSSGENFLFDCNVTNDNEQTVLNYLSVHLPDDSFITAFICSHRDADHIRGIEKVHAKYPIRSIWDSDFPGTTTDSSECKTYMSLRCHVGSKVIQKHTSKYFGATKISCLSAQDKRLPMDANSQGLVLKVEHKFGTTDVNTGSVMLTGDSNGRVWHDAILKDYTARELKSDILMAGHHGSKTFFDCPTGLAFSSGNFTEHLEAIEPDMCVISVGSNSFGHPDEMALKHYEHYSRGVLTGEKTVRTDSDGTIKIELGQASALMNDWNLTTFGKGALNGPRRLSKKFPIRYSGAKSL